jgi:hypothetical protein
VVEFGKQPVQLIMVPLAVGGLPCGGAWPHRHPASPRSVSLFYTQGISMDLQQQLDLTVRDDSTARV